MDAGLGRQRQRLSCNAGHCVAGRSDPDTILEMERCLRLLIFIDFLGIGPKNRSS